jgi:hypothetical protein
VTEQNSKKYVDAKSATADCCFGQQVSLVSAVKQLLSIQKFKHLLQRKCDPDPITILYAQIAGLGVGVGCGYNG